MPGSKNLPLLPHNADETAEQLSALLEQLSFDNGLTKQLDEKKTALRNGNRRAIDYLNDEHIETAVGFIQKRYSYFLPDVLRAWFNAKADAFSKIEKAVLAVDVILFLMVFVFTHDVIEMLFGKAALEATGTGIADTCTGLGPDITNLCGTLSPNEMRVFDMTRRDVLSNSRNGTMSDLVNGPVSGVRINKISGWFIGKSTWFDYVVCGLKDNVTQLVAHSFFGSSADAAAAKGVFPVVMNLVALTGDSLLDFWSLSTAVSSTLMQLCAIFIANGGYSTVTDQQGRRYGHTDSFQNGAKECERAFDQRFWPVYTMFAGLAVLMLLGLGIKKMISKWENSAGERTEQAAIRQASRNGLFNRIAVIQNSTDAFSAHTI